MERLKALEIFSEVAKYGSFAKAADAASVAVPSVSRAVQDLETLLGVQLFNRTTRKVRLTSFGHSVLDHVKTILDGYDSLTQLSNDSTAVCGDVRIEVPALFGMDRLRPVLHAFMQENPRARIDARLVDNTCEVLGELADLAIVVGRPPPVSRIARPLEALTVGIYATPSYLMKNGAPTSPLSLRDKQCMSALPIEGKSGVPLTHRVTGAISEIFARSRFTSNCPTSVAVEALKSEGVAILPNHIAHSFESRGEIVRVLKDWDAEPLPTSLLYQARRNQPQRTRKLIDHIMRVFGSRSNSTLDFSNLQRNLISFSVVASSTSPPDSRRTSRLIDTTALEPQSDFQIKVVTDES